MPPPPPSPQILAIITIWVLTSNLFNASSKSISSFNPWTSFATTSFQLLCAAATGTVIVRRSYLRYPKISYGIIQIGFALALANLTMMWALSRTSVAMFQTLKAGAPLFTAAACYFVLGIRYSNLTYVALIPILFGLAAALLTDFQVDALGLGACVVSSLCQVFVNLKAKEVLEKKLMDIIELQAAVSIVGFGVSALAFVVAVLLTSTSNPALMMDAMFKDFFPPVHFLLFNVFLYSLENVLAYFANGKLARLPFAVVDATRRLTIVIISNYLYAHRTPTWINFVGVALVASGAVGFAFVVEELKFDDDGVVNKL